MHYLTGQGQHPFICIERFLLLNIAPKLDLTGNVWSPGWVSVAPSTQPLLGPGCQDEFGPQCLNEIGMKSTFYAQHERIDKSSGIEMHGCSRFHSGNEHYGTCGCKFPSFVWAPDVAGDWSKVPEGMG